MVDPAIVFKQELQILFIYPDAWVLHLTPQHATIDIEPVADYDLALACKLDGIFYQVDHNLLESELVTSDHHAGLLVILHADVIYFQLVFSYPCQIWEHLLQFAHEVRQVERLFILAEHLVI